MNIIAFNFHIYVSDIFLFEGGGDMIKAGVLIWLFSYVDIQFL